MEIRWINDAAQPVLRPVRERKVLVPKDSPARQNSDSYAGQGSKDFLDDTPFWLIRMSTDRMAGRQYLDSKKTKEGKDTERAWIDELVAKSREPLRVILPSDRPVLSGAVGLTLFQSWVDLLVAQAGFPLSTPRALWQSEMKRFRGQFVFRLGGNLLQLRPGATGDCSDWLGTIAHETFHHFQHELVCALYRGEPELTGTYAVLANYYRDAWAVYKPPSEAMGSGDHQHQALEVGALRYGTSIGAFAHKG